MQVIHATDIDDLRWDLRGAVVGMGTLDGVHVGHQAILGRVAELAAATGAPPGVLTFAQHPLEIVRPQQAPALITPLPLKLALLEQMGMAAAVVIHFTPALAALTAKEFVERALVEGLHVRSLCVGYDFGFGRGRQGNVALLQAMGAVHGFDVLVTPAVSVDGRIVSSSVIRAVLAEGRVAEARKLLGRPYCVAGIVERGSGRGKGLGFATANLPAPAVLKDGVYAGRALVRGAYYDAMMNVGVAPTFGEGARRLEVHIPGWDGPLHGEHLLVFVLERLRDERRFADAEQLRDQLARDRQAAEAVWRASAELPWPEWSLHL